MNDIRKVYKNYLETHPFYSNQAGDYSASIRYFTKNLKKFLPVNKDSQILDIGCGTGDFLHFLKIAGYKNFMGVDISEQQIEYCKKNVTERVFLIDNLKKYLQMKKNEFDFILMNDVVEHLEKETIIDILTTAYNSLKKNGILLIKTENIKSRWGISVRYMDFTHTISFSEESIKQILLNSQFKKIEVHKEIHPIHDFKSFIRVSLKSFFEIIYRFEYIASFGELSPILSNMLIVVATKI